MPGLNFKGTNKYQKIAESMLKKTRFTESEIDRLSDLHANILVRTVFVVWMMILISSRDVIITVEELIGRNFGNFFMTNWT